MPADAKLKLPAAADDRAATADNGFVRDEQKPKNVGLNPPHPASTSGPGMRAPEPTAQPARSKKDAAADRLEADTAGTAVLAKRRDAPAEALDSRAKVAAATERQRQPAIVEAQREIAQAPAAASPRVDAPKPAQMAEPDAGRVFRGQSAGAVAGRLAENKTQEQNAAASVDRYEAGPRTQSSDQAKASAEASSASAGAAKLAAAPAPSPPQAKPASPAVAPSKIERPAELTPEKWLERIEELRKLGRLEEAKTSFAEFRKRYPDYRLPESLREWVKP
jgi:hypothetical protein